MLARPRPNVFSIAIGPDPGRALDGGKSRLWDRSKLGPRLPPLPCRTRREGCGETAARITRPVAQPGAAQKGYGGGSMIGYGGGATTGRAAEGKKRLLANPVRPDFSLVHTLGSVTPVFGATVGPPDQV